LNQKIKQMRRKKVRLLINLDQDLEIKKEEVFKRILKKTATIIRDLIKVTIPMVIGIMDLTTLKEMTLNKEEEEEAINKIVTIEAGIKTIIRETITREIIHGVKIVAVVAVAVIVVVAVAAVIIKAIGVMILIIKITIQKENGQMMVILLMEKSNKTNVTKKVIILEIKDKIIAFKNLKLSKEDDRIITIILIKNGQIITTIRIITKKKSGLKILQKEI